MKLLIQCDEVFDILTRGPFPSGHDHDEAVEHHLRCCHDCRQLAEALRPAVELFHECLSVEEATSLPEYHGSVTPLQQPTSRILPHELSEVRLAHDAPIVVAWDRSAEIAADRRHRRKLLLQGFVGMAMTAAIVLLVVSLGTSMREMNRVPPGNGHNSFVGAPARSPQEAAQQLLALRLPAACWLANDFDASGLKSLEMQIAQALDQHAIACCTRCHSESSEHEALRSPSIHQIATLQKSCLACHKG
jgi:hypothetical protein